MSVARRVSETLCCGLLLSACSGGPEQKLVGTWDSEASDRLNHLELRADGSLSGAVHKVDFVGNKISLGHYAGSWRFLRGHLNLLIVESDVQGLAAGYASSDEILELTDHQLLVRSATGHEENWQR